MLNLEPDASRFRRPKLAGETSHSEHRHAAAERHTSPERRYDDRQQERSHR